SRDRTDGAPSTHATGDWWGGRCGLCEDGARGNGGCGVSDDLRVPAPGVPRPDDWRGDPARGLCEPGAFPVTRAPEAEMYQRRPWTMRQYAGFGTAQATNTRFRALLDAGQTGLSTAFDLPTQMGYDSDHAMASGEVGRVGVAIDTVDDLEILFQGIPLDRVTTS